MSLSEVEITSFSSPQRRCHLLLLFYLPGYRVTLDSLSQVNHSDQQATRQDITEVGREIQRYHKLEVQEDVSGVWRLQGEELNKRLCLLHWLRRALRLSPDFVRQHFAAGLRQHLAAQRTEKALYDEHNLQALLRHCAQQLNRSFSPRDSQFLQLFLQYCLCATDNVTLSEQQTQWLQSKPEWQIGRQVMHCWHKRRTSLADDGPFIALLFSLIYAPQISQVNHQNERRLNLAISALTARFQQLSGMHFSDQSGLQAQLYTHLSQALDRVIFDIGIDDSLAEEITALYPRLLRTTQQALSSFERDFSIRFCHEEVSLVAVIFGAWLMQENTLQEKQVLLLTGRDEVLEKQVEQQLRELTLLPLNIKHLDVQLWQRQGAPEGIALVVSPYATALPLYSPPLIHAELPLSDYHQQRIRALLEA
ncbi:stationary phase inducible protein CsiE [Izhakiella australiensis]|uniref:Stationary phase inducible protein CsiE n=1 Tax=Izhakiella australiensis TaxID=1926881 RepID=A0A1S8YFL6_9GAMM|nr:stationary phase inducible protein CsiE [Izhakiella australiensis]OON37587.1 stationary phase inducible protein CsiE [Izhakiella australiensis]